MMILRRWMRVMIVLGLMLAAAVLVRQCLKPRKPYREVRPLMATVISLEACPDISQEKINTAFAAAWPMLEEIAWRMNVYDEKSDVARINASFESPVDVPDDTRSVVHRSIEMNFRTAGAFDITVWPLIRIWREAAQAQTLPDTANLARAMAAVGPRQVLIQAGGKVELLHPKTRIDLGGIAKGYAVDEAVRILRDHGLRNFRVDAGGDGYVSGTNCQNEPWRIGIQDPATPDGILHVVRVSDAAVATSGDYEQYLDIAGERWSHIIDPRTGYPQRHINSATVIAPTAMDADALATALTVLAPNEGVKVIDGFGDGYASLTVSRSVSAEGWEEFQSQSMPRYVETSP